MVSMSAVWDRTAEFLSDNLTTLVPIALALLFVPNAVSGALEPLSAAAVEGSRTGYAFASLALSLIAMWGNLAIVALVLDPVLSARGAATVAGRRMPPAVGVLVVGLIALLLLWSPLFAILAASGMSATAMGSNAAAIPAGARTGIGLSMLVLLPLTLWLLARFMVLLTPVLVGERRGVGALGRAWSLSRGIGWRVLGVMILYFVLAWVVVTATRTVVGSVLRLLADDDGPLSLASVLTSVMVGAVATALTVMAAVFSAKLYIAVRDGREGAARPS